jgi:glyoxylase-like metal-dependent hydrolase (beta-lactamase superfamily II)
MTENGDYRVEPTAELHVLCVGYLGRPDHRVGSTVTFVRDGDVRLVIDPGLVSSPLAILDPLAELGVGPGDVTDVVFSHHHPDHTLNAALFPAARFHDHWAIYQADLWTSRPADGFQLAPSVCLVETPGHTPQDITTLVGTPDGAVALTHLWWNAEGPIEDPYATDGVALHANRGRVLSIPGLALIVPGHGPQFTPTAATPR